MPQGIQRTWGNHPAWPVVFTQAKTAPLCKGSCRRTPTEGLTAIHRTQAVLPVPSRRTQAVLPHPTIENQLNHSPGFTIPPAWLRHAVPPLHKGGCGVPPAQCLGCHIALPRWAIEPRPVVCWASLSPGKHNRPFPRHWARTASRPLPVLARQHRSTGANNAYSLQRVLGAAARRYFVLRRNNTLPRPKIPLWGFWSSSPQRRLWLLGGANLGRWEIKCSWAHRGVSP